VDRRRGVAQAAHQDSEHEDESSHVHGALL
jgi:hypothetical protein